MSRSGTFACSIPGVSIERLRRLALEALDRARFEVQAVPVKGGQRTYTIAMEPEPASQAGLTREDAERYVASINNEAELARAMLLVLAELERLAAENSDARRRDISNG